MHQLIRAIVGCLCAGAAVVSASPSAVDPATWLAQARSAIGGDVATESVTSLRIRGSKRRNLAGGNDFSWEAFWEAPDKFVQVETWSQTFGPLGNMSTTRRFGFNGPEEIAHTISDLPSPPPPRNKPNALVPMHQKALAQLLLPLFASATPLAGVTPFTMVEPDPSVPARAGLNLVAFAAPDGGQMHLWVDATTRLPSALSWMDEPIVVTSTTSIMTMTTTERVPAGQAPSRPMPMPPSMPPPSPSVPGGGRSGKVQWELKLSDYKADKGVTWPRRIAVTMGTAVWEEVRISRYEINPKINSRTFEVRK